MNNVCFNECWWQIDAGIRFSILVTSLEFWCLTPMLKDKWSWWRNGRNRHRHLKVVANTFRLQDLSPTSMQPIRNILNNKKLNLVKEGIFIWQCYLYVYHTWNLPSSGSWVMTHNLWLIVDHLLAWASMLIGQPDFIPR